MTPEQREELKTAASAATQGPWVHTQFGVIKAGPMCEYINGQTQQQIGMLTGADWMRDGEREANANYVQLANPAAILSLIAQVEAYQSDAELNAACTSAFQGESLDEKALNALLWFYRRAESAYGRLPFAEEAITGLRARIAAAPTIPGIPGTKEDAT